MKDQLRRPRSRAEAERLSIAADLNRLAGEALMADYRADPTGRNIPRFRRVMGLDDPPTPPARAAAGGDCTVAAARALIARRRR